MPSGVLICINSYLVYLEFRWDFWAPLFGFVCVLQVRELGATSAGGAVRRLARPGAARQLAASSSLPARNCKGKPCQATGARWVCALGFYQCRRPAASSRFVPFVVGFDLLVLQVFGNEQSSGKAEAIFKSANCSMYCCKGLFSSKQFPVHALFCLAC